MKHTHLHSGSSQNGKEIPFDWEKLASEINKCDNIWK